ncbi:MAG: DegT/DnrJ/EryC1/StrS family aminotransferase [Pseudobdellovibrio sp.]
MKLAIKGGTPVRTAPFKTRSTIGAAEKKAVNDVLDRGDISLFFGSPGEYFLGGPSVKKFENDWAQKYNFKHAISVNSWTTGLMTAVGAVGVEPGDEVICTPYSMSATATAILFYGGIPVFVDIEPETFNLDPAKIEAAITPRTKAIMLVHLFGHPADMDAILKIAKKHNLKVIEDAAHAPGVKYKGRYVGAIGDIGGFSFNYHKHIHTGEGGLIVTQDEELAKRCQLIRNHGENCTEALGVTDISSTIGTNYRLTEIQAAVGSVQMTYLADYIAHRNKLAKFFSDRISKFNGITAPVIKPDCEHAFYVYAMKFDEQTVGVSRKQFVAAVHAELPKAGNWEQAPFVEAYVRPLYLNQVYQKQIAIGKKGFPFNMNPSVKYNYQKGICPVVEDMFENRLFHSPLIREAVTEADLTDVLNAVEKVYTNIDQLRD